MLVDITPGARVPGAKVPAAIVGKATKPAVPTIEVMTVLPAIVIAGTEKEKYRALITMKTLQTFSLKLMVMMVVVLNLYSAFSIDIFKCALRESDLWKKTRPQHWELCALLFAMSVWVL